MTTADDGSRPPITPKPPSHPRPTPKPGTPPPRQSLPDLVRNVRVSLAVARYRLYLPVDLSSQVPAEPGFIPQEAESLVKGLLAEVNYALELLSRLEALSPVRVGAAVGRTSRAAKPPFAPGEEADARPVQDAATSSVPLGEVPGSAEPGSGVSFELPNTRQHWARPASGVDIPGTDQLARAINASIAAAGATPGKTWLYEARS